MVRNHAVEGPGADQRWVMRPESNLPMPRRVGVAVGAELRERKFVGATGSRRGAGNFQAEQHGNQTINAAGFQGSQSPEL